MEKALSLLLISALFISFSGCGDDDAASPSMTLSIDGTDIKIVSVTATLSFETLIGHEVRGLKINGLTRDNHSINVQITNWDFQTSLTNGFVKKKYYNIFGTEQGADTAECLEVEGANLCDGGLIVYTTMNETQIYTSTFNEDLVGYIEVTSSNGKKISGNFDAIVTGIGNEVDLHATGTFKNVGYMISN